MALLLLTVAAMPANEAKPIHLSERERRDRVGPQGLDGDQDLISGIF